VLLDVGERCDCHTQQLRVAGSGYVAMRCVYYTVSAAAQMIIQHWGTSCSVASSSSGANTIGQAPVSHDIGLRVEDDVQRFEKQSVLHWPSAMLKQSELALVA